MADSSNLADMLYQGQFIVDIWPWFGRPVNWVQTLYDMRCVHDVRTDWKRSVSVEQLLETIPDTDHVPPVPDPTQFNGAATGAPRCMLSVQLPVRVKETPLSIN